LRSELILEKTTSDQIIIEGMKFNTTPSQFDEKYTNPNILTTDTLKNFVLGISDNNINSEYMELKLSDFKNSWYLPKFNPIQSIEPQTNSHTGTVSSRQSLMFWEDLNLNVKRDELIGLLTAHTVDPLNTNEWVKMPRKFSVKTNYTHDIDKLISNLKNRFDITNVFELKQFINSASIQTIENFNMQLNQVTDVIISFLNVVSKEFENKIEIFKDDEINDFESISIECYVKGSNSVQCIEWTEELVSKIIEIDKKILDVLQIEIIPYE